MQIVQRISPCLWFDHQAEQAAKFYTTIFKNSKIGEISHYPEAGQEQHGRRPGSVMTVAFELEGQYFLALNGGPHFTFNEAISLMVFCDTQDEIDFYTERLSHVPEAHHCGWVKDRFGVSWQIVPRIMPQLITNPDHQKVERYMAAMMKMKKLDMAALMKAAA